METVNARWGINILTNLRNFVINTAVDFAYSCLKKKKPEEQKL